MIKMLSLCDFSRCHLSWLERIEGITGWPSPVHINVADFTGSSSKVYLSRTNTNTNTSFLTHRLYLNHNYGNNILEEVE